MEGGRLGASPSLSFFLRQAACPLDRGKPRRNETVLLWASAAGGIRGGQRLGAGGSSVLGCAKGELLQGVRLGLINRSGLPAPGSPSKLSLAD